MMTDRPGILVIDVGGLSRVDIATVGALARIALEAGRRGERVAVVGTSPQLFELLALSGLGRVLRVGMPRSIDPRR